MGCQVYTPTVLRVLDLSEAGALLDAPCLLRLRSLYAVRLVLGRDAVLLLRATVVRSYADHLDTRGPETRVRCHAALHFIDPSPREKALLRHGITGRGWPATRTQEASPDVERRESGRMPLEGSVEAEVGLRLWSSVRLLSHGGMLVQMPFAPQLGSLVSCSFEIDGQPLQLDAAVRHARPVSVEEVNPPQSVGLEFIGRSGAARTAIEAYVARSLQAPGEGH
jgi:hypothetical protein